MGLREFFGGKEDAVAAWQREMRAAVKNGDVAQLRGLLDKPIEAPPEALDDILARTIKNRQMQMTRAVLEKDGARSVDIGVLRQVVYDEDRGFYRLLAEKGWDFSRYVPSENGGSYLARLRYLQKDHECERLKEELQAARQEITQLRKAQGLPEKPAEGRSATDDPPPPARNFSL